MLKKMVLWAVVSAFFIGNLSAYNGDVYFSRLGYQTFSTSINVSDGVLLNNLKEDVFRSLLSEKELRGDEAENFERFVLIFKGTPIKSQDELDLFLDSGPGLKELHFAFYKKGK